jgi:hypothetical protein
MKKSLQVSRYLPSPKRGTPMGSFDRYYTQADDEDNRIRGHDDTERREGVLPFRAGSPAAPTKVCGAALNLVYQAAEVIKDIESQASNAEKTSYQKLQIAQKRIEELEAELRSAQSCINEARVKLKESNELAKAEKSRLDEAERRMCELEMRARTAEMQARENANSVLRVEEAIRTQILSKRLPSNTLNKAG